MSDPLSVLAGIAGVATAGVAISKMMYEVAHTVKHAPKEVSEMAGELTLLSSVLRHLRSAMADCIDMCKPRLIKDIRGTMSKIKDLHSKIKDLTKNSTRSFYRVELLFKSPKTRNLLEQVGAFKDSVAVMISTVQLAVAKKQLKLHNDLASKSEVGEIRQLLENLLSTNQDSINRVRRRRTSLYDDYPYPFPGVPPPPPPPGPGPPQRNRRGRQRPAPPPPPALRESPGLSPPTPSKSDIKPPQPPSNTLSTRFGEGSSNAPAKNSGARQSRPKASSGADPQPPSFVDWDSEKEEEIKHDHEDNNNSSDTENTTSTALVHASHYQTENPFSTKSLAEKKETVRKDTRFQIPHKNVFDIRFDANKGSDSESNISSERESESESDGTEWDYIDDIAGSHPQTYNGYDSYRSVALGTREGSPDDAATWLYRLVFLEDEKSENPFALPSSTQLGRLTEMPRTAERLLLQWTTVEPDAEKESDSDTDLEMTDPDPSWSRRLRSHISRMQADAKPSIRFDRVHNDIDSDGSDLDNHMGHRNRRDPSRCRHNRIRADCVICSDPFGSERVDGGRDDTSRRPRRSHRSGISPSGTGASYRSHQGYPPGYMPDVPYAEYQRTDQERAYQTHRSETLLKDIERLETTFRRTEALHSKEISHRERMELQIQKQHRAEMNALSAQIERGESFLTKQLTVQVKEKEEAMTLLEKRLREALEEKELLRILKQKEKAMNWEKSFPQRKDLQISTLTDRNHSWSPRFPSLGLAFSRVDTAPSPESIHGTLCFSKPFLPSLSELYDVLKKHEWKQLWMRGSSSGKTWFLGKTPILVDFIHPEYMPQVGKQEDQAGIPVYMNDSEDEYAAVGMGIVERDAIDELSLPYKGRVDGQFRFSVQVTYEDIESLIATSLLMRERRQRKACLEDARSLASPIQNTSTSPRASASALKVPPIPDARPPTSGSSRSEVRSPDLKRRHRKTTSSKRDL